MSKRNVLRAVFSLSLFLGFCRSETAETVATDTAKTHYGGGCVMLSRATPAPVDLYMNTGVVPTDEYPPFTKKITVYGYTLVARDDVADDFMRRVAQTITETLPQDGTDTTLQKEFIRNMYEYRALIPLYKGRDRITSPEGLAAWNSTRSQNSVCDVIMELEPGPEQVHEVVEHILHYANDIGIHYTFPDEWAITTDSQLYRFLLESEAKGYYDYQYIVKKYDGIENEERRLRVILQEFSYKFISTAWDLNRPHDMGGSNWTLKNSDELKAMMPEMYTMYERTVAKFMTAPNLSTLDGFLK